MKKNIHYEVRLKKNIKRKTKTESKLYKKGLVLWDCSEKHFLKMNKKNIEKHLPLAYCEGHGSYEYFTIDEVEFVKVETVIKTIKKVVKLSK